MSAPEALTVEGAAERIRTLDGKVRAFISTRLDAAMAEAVQRRAEPARSPLHAHPYSLKDVWDTTDLPTSGGSYRYRQRSPALASPVREVFDAAGAVLMGKTNTSDLGLPPEATSYVGGATRCPFDDERTAGGSSGGAAAAVANGMVSFDWGSDFGGSIRLPAAFCGVLGMRLSSETWPVLGNFPSPPESVRFMYGQGPLARTVPRMRAVLAAAAPRLRSGPARSFSIRGVVTHPADRGFWPDFAREVSPELARLGELAGDAGLPSTTRVRNLAIAMYAAHFDDMLAGDELSFGEGLLAALSALLFGGRLGDKRLHPSTARLVLLMALGRYTIFRDKQRARNRAAQFADALRALWGKGFVVAAPVSAYPPPRIGTSTSNPHLISCCVAANLSDATAISIPWGRFEGGLPRSLQLMGPPGSELQLLDAAEALITQGPSR